MQSLTETPGAKKETIWERGFPETVILVPAGLFLIIPALPNTTRSTCETTQWLGAEEWIEMTLFLPSPPFPRLLARNLLRMKESDTPNPPGKGAVGCNKKRNY
jgi:hypothetical protein